MNETVKMGLLTLVRCAITGEKIDLPIDFDIFDVMEIAKKHQIIPLVYYGALNCGISGDSSALAQMFNAVCQCMVLNQQQMFAIKCISKSFDEKGIDYMLLKGTLLKSLYPKSEMRSMGDADILIRLEQYNEIKTILSGMGYTEKTQSDHEFLWTKPELFLELHKRLIPSYNKDYYAYYGDGWQLAKPSEDNKYCYVMSNEDQMIYLFTHFAKHYRDGGIGIKHLVDLYVYRKANSNLNENYIKRELVKLGLYDFYCNILKTIDVWFNDAKSDNQTELITDIILHSGAYGTAQKQNIAQTVRYHNGKNGHKNAKIKRFFTMVFPGVKEMKLRYTYLEKAPILLPIAWISRFVRILFTKRKEAKSFFENVKKVSVKEINEYEKALHFVGLDFKFEE